MNTFADFEVWIGEASPAPAGGSTFAVNVFSSPAGPAAGACGLNLDAQDFQQSLEQVRAAVADLGLREAFGRQLFKALFTGEVADAWVASNARVDAGEYEGLRLRLWINDPALARLPWELLYDDKFIAAAPERALSRYLPVPEPMFYAGRAPLRVLLVIESPPALPAITDEEIAGIKAALDALAGKVDYTSLRNATRAQLQQELQRGYNILHFIGHGTAGKVMLIDDDGQHSKALDDVEFAQLIGGRRSLRLVVLNACDSAQADEGLFSGLGPALVRRRIPAVVAMQYPFVYVDTASKFSARFYESLANGLPADVAVNEGRHLISGGQLLADRDWSTPVLYMGTRNGQIVNLLTGQSDQTERAWIAVQEAAQDSPTASAALTEVAARLQELAAYHEQTRGLLSLLEVLRAAREQFAPLSRLADPREIIDLRAVRPQWNGLTTGSLEQSDRLTARLYRANPPAALAALQAARGRVADSLRDEKFNPLRLALQETGLSLAAAETAVRDELNEAITSVLALSQRTLGQMNL